MNTWDPEYFVQAVNFASRHHAGQMVPGTQEPYLRHLATVASEVMWAISVRGDVERPNLAVVCAILHDCLEDTDCSLEELEATFGLDVSAGVAALTKNPQAGDKGAQMLDSLARIQQQPHEIWMVKLADRITNLQPPPSHWDEAKIGRYRSEARLIHTQLQSACPVLGARLALKIENPSRLS